MAALTSSLRSCAIAGTSGRPVPRPVAYHSRAARSSRALPVVKTRQNERSLVVRGIPVSGPGPEAEAGQITAALIASMEQKISTALEATACNVTDVYGDGRHVSIDVVSPKFDGQSAMQRQRMVYKAIWEELQGAVHAVDAMTTKTPTELGAK